MKIRLTSQCLILATILALILTGCATSPPVTQLYTEPDAEILQRIQAAIEKDDLEYAARAYLRLAEQSSTLKQPEFQLRAASLFIRINFIQQATQLLEKITPASLHDLQYFRRQLLTAKIALINHRPGAALQALNYTIPAALTDAQQAELYYIRAAAHGRRSNPLKAVQNYILSNGFISATEKILSTQYKIWQLLASIPGQNLNNINSAPAPDAFTGWLALIRIARDSYASPIDVSARIKHWRSLYPRHAVDQAIINAMLARQGKVTRHPDKIALLLPFSGTYKKPASIIRDGFLAAYYQHSKNKISAPHPQIHIYDTLQFTSINQAYDQAVEDGADFIVGPLIKEDVTRLNRRRQLPVPTLTLNYGEEAKAVKGLYQFGLSPEQEAQQAAERAWLDGHNQAIMITPDSDWGKRIAWAFADHWQQLGGNLMKQQTYPGQKNDFSIQLQELLELDLSKARHHQLKLLLKEDLRFEPRRRQDADFIFLAAFPRQARLLRPQLKFHYASNLPIYATSHIFTGKRNRYKDRDMDGIIFSDTPWTLNKSSGPLKRQINKLWPDNLRDYTRFYALGIDAYRLIPQLEYLRMFNHERFNGVTGVIHLDENQRVFRTLKWAQFKKGLPSLLQ